MSQVPGAAAALSARQSVSMLDTTAAEIQATMEIIDGKQILKSTGVEREQWVQAALSEYNALTANDGLVEASAADLQDAEYLPMKSIFGLKPGRNSAGDKIVKKKVRTVVCGNFSRQNESFITTPSLDLGTLRTSLCLAGAKQKFVWTGDFRAAFMNAFVGKGRKIAVKFPRTFCLLLGMDPEQTYLVLRAAYGIREAPRWWSMARDKVLREFRWVSEGVTLHLEQSDLDENLWIIKNDEGTIMGEICLYVDDSCLTSEHQFVGDSFYEEIAKVWELSSLDCICAAQVGKVIGFCGLELSYVDDGRGGKALRISQESYTKQVLVGRDMMLANPAATPCDTADNVTPQTIKDEVAAGTRVVDMSLLTDAQAAVGELLWLSTRTRPDISFGVGRAATVLSVDPGLALQRVKRIHRYLRGSMNHSLISRKFGEADYQVPVVERQLMDVMDRRGLWSDEYEGARLAVDTQADASFAPDASYSHGGFIISVGSMAVHWRSSRQKVVTSSSAEAELYTQAEASHSGEGVVMLLEELGHPAVNCQKTDNQAVLGLISSGSSVKTRHLAIRAKSLLDQLERGVMVLNHRPGNTLVADQLTKSLTMVLNRRFVRLMRLTVEDLFVEVADVMSEVGLSKPSNVDVDDEQGLMTSETGVVDLNALICGQVSVNTVSESEVWMKGAASLFTNLAEHVIKASLTQDPKPVVSEPRVVEVVREVVKEVVIEKTSVEWSSLLLATLVGAAVSTYISYTGSDKKQVDVGVQSMDTYSRSSSRFKFLGTKSDDYFEKTNEYTVKTSYSCCRRRKYKKFD